MQGSVWRPARKPRRGRRAHRLSRGRDGRAAAERQRRLINLVYLIMGTGSHAFAHPTSNPTRAKLLQTQLGSERKLPVDRLPGVLFEQLLDHSISILGRPVTHYQCKSRKSVSHSVEYNRLSTLGYSRSCFRRHSQTNFSVLFVRTL